jgi:molybdate transport system ATP-binding protein
MNATKCLRAVEAVAADPSLENLAHVGVTMEGVENRFTGTVEHPDDGAGESVLRLDGGPALIVPWLDCPAGTSVTVRVRADDILLARGPIAGLSARNMLAGTVVRLVEHGHAAEVLVRTGHVEWIVSVVAPAVVALGLCPGTGVHLIVKARSCHVGAGPR